jgi:hypothetical protein
MRQMYCRPREENGTSQRREEEKKRRKGCIEFGVCSFEEADLYNRIVQL